MNRYKERRTALIDRVKKQYEPANGAVLLISDFEHIESGSRAFRQESSFYYLTGITEPAVAMLIDLYGNETLFIPRSTASREQWVTSTLAATPQRAIEHGFTAIEYLGGPAHGYSFPLLFDEPSVSELVGKIKEITGLGGTIYTTINTHPHTYVQQKIALERLKGFGGGDALKDISPIIADLRRTKSNYEIEQIYRAVDLTVLAHQSAALSIGEGVRESEIKAGIEYFFQEDGNGIAFPSIVASGVNGTVLHYEPRSTSMKKGELVVVDIGAEFNHYCADITRTYPVTGVFTQRQREVYNVVLDTQSYIASLAAPGYWLNNPSEPEKSLHHLACAFLAERGYAEYFPHSIGHFLGLDVHDVGNTSEPLRAGDVITIEPGIYIRGEQLGIRIEDDYWIIDDGNICLSENLPRTPEEIEELVQTKVEVEMVDEEGEDDEDENFEIDA